MLEHFDTLHQYFIATLAHWLICGVAGAVILHSQVLKSVAHRTFGIMLACWWIIYEIVEFERIHDLGDVDIANGLGAFIVGFTLAWIYHRIRKR